MTSWNIFHIFSDNRLWHFMQIVSLASSAKLPKYNKASVGTPVLSSITGFNNSTRTLLNGYVATTGGVFKKLSWTHRLKIVQPSVKRSLEALVFEKRGQTHRLNTVDADNNNANAACRNLIPISLLLAQAVATKIVSSTWFKVKKWKKRLLSGFIINSILFALSLLWCRIPKT